MKAKSYSTFSRSNVALPIEDFRINPRSTWIQFLDEHEQTAKIYNLVIYHIISPHVGTHLNTLRSILRNKYAINHFTIENFVQFIVTHETKHIEFEQKHDCRLPIIFLKPRSLVSIVGQYCIWINNDKLKIQPCEGLER